MTLSRSEQLNELKNLLDLLEDHRIAVVRTSVVPRFLSAGRVRISWPALDADLPWNLEVETAETYRRWVLAGAFSAQLFDGALLQMTFDYRNDELIGHRLAYIPSPYELRSIWADGDSIYDVLDLVTDGRADDVLLRGSLRFDYDPGAAAPMHSASHLTLLSVNARIPAVGPLSLGHFVRFIFKHFYPEEWRDNAFLRSWGLDYGTRTISQNDTYEMHVGWNSR